MIGEKISIITISYNSKQTIERTFQSILKQSYRPLEYVLVDGLSTDGTIELIQKYIPLFQNAGIEVIFKSEADNGISDAFNKGIQRATGSIIGIINSDDYVMESALAIVAEEFEPNIGVMCGNCRWNDTKNNITYIRKSKIDQLSKLKYEMVLMHPACFVRKNIYEKYGGFDTSLRYVMDKDIMARFYKKGVQFKYKDVVLTTMSAGGVSDIDKKQVYKEGVQVAMRNGVPRYIAEIRWRYKAVRAWGLERIKKNRKLWRILKK